MHPRKKTIKELEKNGFIFKKHGASHDLYFQPNTKQTIPVKRHDLMKMICAISSKKQI